MAQNQNETQTAGRSPVAISQCSSVTVGMAVVLCGWIALGTAWKVGVDRDLLDGKRERAANAAVIESYRKNIERLESGARDLAILQKLVLDLTSGAKPWNSPSAWRRFSMVRWSDDLRYLNPSVVVPDASKTEYLDTDTGMVIKP